MNLTSFYNKKTLKILLITAAVLAVLIIIFARSDQGNSPEIKCTEEQLLVSVDATDKELLSGITATDKEDGDISESIIIESYSDFVSTGVRSITYAVMDSDFNVSKFTRNVEYEDYESPRFHLSINPVIGVGGDSNLLEGLTAEDCLDGDLTGKIRLLSSDVDEEETGLYTTKYAVTNSAGDISEIEIPVTVSDDFAGESPVKLSDYITYTKKGKSRDYSKFISSSTNPVEMKKHGNFSVPGYCYVDYMIDGTVYARLVVVVE